MVQVKITWNSISGNRPSASATVQLHPIWDDSKNLELLNTLHKVTNLQNELAEFGAKTWELEMWATIAPLLPANRPHTSLSIGDEIQINRTDSSIANEDGPTYRISEIGFEMVVA